MTVVDVLSFNVEENVSLIPYNYYHSVYFELLFIFVVRFGDCTCRLEAVLGVKPYLKD